MRNDAPRHNDGNNVLIGNSELGDLEQDDCRQRDIEGEHVEDVCRLIRKCLEPSKQDTKQHEEAYHYKVRQVSPPWLN